MSLPALLSAITAVAVAVTLGEPMVGVLLIALALVAIVLSRSFHCLPWLVLGAKLVLVAIVSLAAPALWPHGGGLIAVNPDQQLYIDTAHRIADVLRESPFSVDYAGIVGLHNRSYSVALGWLAFLNGRGSILLYRLFNVFLSLLLGAFSAALARYLYPSSPHVARFVFLGVALLPSVNAYAMFVLRDVLIAAIVSAVALGLFGRRLWLMLAGVALAYFTRIQLFFLLSGAVILFVGLRMSRRLGRHGALLRGAFTAAFVIGGYFVAPLVLPPEHDYTQAWSLRSFGQFVVGLPSSLLGLDFLRAAPEDLELGRETLGLTRLLLFDTWLVPLLFFGAIVWYRKLDARWREFWLWVWALALGYAAGYWIAYGKVYVRLMVPLYPLFVVVAGGGLGSTVARWQRKQPGDSGARRRVLFLATVYTHLAAFHVPFMRLLQGWGYEVHAAASPAEGRKDELEAAGVVCHDVPFVRSPVRPRNLAAYRDLRRLLDRHRFDLIHVHTPMAAWLGRLAARRARQGPVLYTAHGFHFYRGAPWPYWLFYYPAERLAARWTDALIVMNGEDFRRARGMGFREGENLFLVHGVGVDLATYTPPEGVRERMRGELSLGPEEFVVTCVAEFTATKNHAQLIGAWPRVVGEAPRSQLLLVGDGPLRAHAESEARKRRVPNVRFLGFRRDVPALLAGSDAFVLPSKREGLPRSVLEAMAAGLPVVATDVRGNRDLVEPGKNGLLVKVGDPGGLAQALLTLSGDPELRRRLGREGQVMAEAYALDRVLGEMATIYRRFLPETGGSDR